MSWLLGGGAAEEGKAREKGAEAEAGAGGSGAGDAANSGRAYTERCAVWGVNAKLNDCLALDVFSRDRHFLSVCHTRVK